MDGLVVYAIAITLFLGISVYANFNLLRSAEDQDDSILEADERVEEMSEWIIDFKQKVETAFLQMRELDTRGAFEAEDEVGDVFKGLIEIIEDLQKITNPQ